VKGKETNGVSDAVTSHPNVETGYQQRTDGTDYPTYLL
jgi:hypothetical protein